MGVKTVRKGVDWPGYASIINAGKWDDLRKALDMLYVGGPAVVISLDDPDEVESAQASVSHYARRQNAKEAGWLYQTTSRGNEVYVRKVARRK